MKVAASVITYRQAVKAGSPLLSLKGQPCGLAYKDWLGLALGAEDKFNRTVPAEIVREQSYRRLRPAEPLYLWCFGFDMDNAKARCWYEHRLPSLAIDKAAQLQFTNVVELAVAGDAACRC